MSHLPRSQPLAHSTQSPQEPYTAKREDTPNSTMRCGCLANVLSLDETLSKEDARKRTLFFAINVATFAFMLLFIVSDLRHLMVVPIVGACVFLGTATSFVGMVVILCRVRITQIHVVVCACCFVVTVVLSDLDSRAKSSTFWAPLVLVVDFLLVMQVDAKYSVGLVACSVVWLVTMAAEQQFRFGLFDIPGLSPQDGEYGRRDAWREKVECEKLPCSTDALQDMMSALMVFLIDFVATRGFARVILKEQASMQRTIATVQDIASLLAGYDVEQVAELLEEHGGELPDGMTAALRRLEQNLRVYKAYLPQTCLPFEVEKGGFAKDRSLSLSRAEKTSETSGEESSVSSNLSSSVTKVFRPFICVQPICLSTVKSTLLTLNIKDTLHRLEEDSARFSDLFTTVLLKTLQATDSRRGMVDVFVGDRIHCSFNASKQCASHATSALHAATLLIQTCMEVDTCGMNLGVASGKVLRGDMGCDVMRRFSMVGTLVRDVHGMERAGRMLGCDVVCNRLCFSDAECEHDLRLLPCKVEVAQDCEPEVVAELVVPKHAPHAAAVDEWMYQIGGKKHWEDYNQAVRKYLKGEVSADDVNSAAATDNLAGTPVHVAARSYKDDVLQLTCHSGRLN